MKMTVPIWPLATCCSRAHGSLLPSLWERDVVEEKALGILGLIFPAGSPAYGVA